jgi:very-short-patch-repair endonuclease
MDLIDTAALDLLHRQHGVAARRQLRALGFSDRRIDGWITAGAMVRLQPATVQLGGSPATVHQVAAAACLANPNVVAAGRTAGRMWQLRNMPVGPALVLATSSYAPQLHDVEVWRTRLLPDHHVVVRSDGIRVTAPHRTLLELARELPTDDALASAMAQVRDRYNVSLRLLHQLKRESGLSGRPGAARFTRVLAAMDGQRPAQSEPELVLARAIVAAGLARPVPQFEITLPGIGAIRADLAFPDARLIVEFDHSHWHAYGRTVVGRDKRRDRQLAALGWVVLRFDEDDLALCLDDVIAEIAGVLALRCAS